MSIVLLKNLNYIHFFIYCTSSNYDNPGEDWVNIDRKKNKESWKKVKFLAGCAMVWIIYNCLILAEGGLKSA